MTKNTITRAAISILCLPMLVACSHTEPLESSVTSPTAAKLAPVSDQTVIAQTVGNAPTNAGPLAWANPSTGSAGVIQNIAPVNNGEQGCRGFVSSNHGLEGNTKLGGLACPSDGTWKITGAPGLH
jgi:surface antigen